MRVGIREADVLVNLGNFQGWAQCSRIYRSADTQVLGTQPWGGGGEQGGGLTRQKALGSCL